MPQESMQQQNKHQPGEIKTMSWRMTNWHWRTANLSNGKQQTNATNIGE